MIDVSIIIPHYNSVDKLKKLLLSIPNKRNIQVIVIDDKSNKKLNEFSNLKKTYDHVLFLKNTTDEKGAGVCRNIGLQYVIGNWVLFADADDYFVEGFYDIISDFFNSDYEVIFFKPTSIEVDTGNKSDRHIKYAKYIDDYIDNGNEVSDLQLRYRFFVPWSKMVQYDFILNNNINFEEVIASNDVMFSTRVGYCMNEFKAVKEVIYCVTKGFGTLTTNTNPIIYESKLKEFIKYYKFLEVRLSKKEFKLLRLHGLGMLFNAVQNRLGWKKVISVFRLLKKCNIRLFDARLLNPKYHYIVFKKHMNKRKYLLKR